jgi:hypothetical protein
MRPILLSLLAGFVLFANVAPAQNIGIAWKSCTNGSLKQPFINDVAVDAAGNTYTTGYTVDSSYYANRHYFLQKTSSTGVQEWLRTYPAKDSFDLGYTVVVDTRGYIYVAGSRMDSFCNICTEPNKVTDMFTLKYNAAGDVIWFNRYNGGQRTLQTPKDIVTDNKGIVYVAVSERTYNPRTYDYSTGLALVKITRNGAAARAKLLPAVVPNALTFDKTGNIIVAGSLQKEGIYQLEKIHLLKFNSQLDTLWTRTFAERGKNGSLKFVSTDDAGNIFVNGQTDTITFYNEPRIITMKYSTDGLLKWWKKEVGHSYAYYSNNGLFVDAKSNVYTIGFTETGYNNDWLTVKYNTNGVKKWTAPYDDSIHGYDVPVSVSGNAYGVVVAGISTSKGGFHVYNTIQYDFEGGVLWSRGYTSAPRTENFVAGLGIDASGGIYTIGAGGSHLCIIKFVQRKSPGAGAEGALLPVQDKIIQVYPNPAHNILKIVLPEEYSFTHYNVTDISGRTLLTSSITSFNKLQTINVQTLHAGTYLLVLYNKEGTQVVKFIKE